MPRFRILLFAFVLISALPGTAKAGFINWTSFSNPAGTTTVFGQMIRSTITATVSGTGGSARIHAPSSFINDNFNWSGAAFTPNVLNSDALYFENLVAGSVDTWTIGFSAPVVDPVFHFLGLERTYTFDSGIALLSDDNGTFVVSGNSITGHGFTPGNKAGTLQIFGTYTSLTIVGTGVPGVGHNRDATFFQIGATEFIEPDPGDGDGGGDPVAVSEPTTGLLLLLGVAAVRRMTRRVVGRSGET